MTTQESARPCQVCGNPLLPTYRRGAQPSRRKYCDSCRVEYFRARMQGPANPMNNAACRAKVARTLRERGVQPIMRWNPGLGPTPHEARLAAALGDEWATGVAIPTGLRPPYPRCYRLDVTCVGALMCVEVDGSSHQGLVKK